MKKVLLFIFFVSCFASCKKQTSKTTVSGRVLDGTTLKPLVDKTVYLLAQNRDCFSCSGHATVEKHQTNSEGKFDFSFKPEEEYSYYVTAKANQYGASNN